MNLREFIVICYSQENCLFETFRIRIRKIFFFKFPGNVFCYDAIKIQMQESFSYRYVKVVNASKIAIDIYLSVRISAILVTQSGTNC